MNKRQRKKLRKKFEDTVWVVSLPDGSSKLLNDLHNVEYFKLDENQPRPIHMVIE
jgi:hypothetical protein